MKKRSRVIAWILSLSIIIGFSGCGQNTSAVEQKGFDDFINTQFVELMEESVLNAHVFIENPENYGINKDNIKDVIDTPINDETFNKEMEKIKELKKEFNKFNRKLLTDEQKDTYDIYEYQLGLEELSTSEKFRYMGVVFSTNAGIHTQLPMLFADFSVKNEEDVENLIALLGNVKPYIDSLLEFTKKQSENGTLMIDIDWVVEYCKSVREPGIESSVLKSMIENIESLNLGNEKNERYKKELENVFESSFLEAYDNIIDTLESIDKSKNNTQGLYYLEGGKDYYEVMFKAASGSNKSIKEIKKDLMSLMEESIEKVESINEKNPDIFEKWANNEYVTEYNDYKTILDDLGSNIKEDFPFIENQDYGIKEINKEIVSEAIAAYFNIPAIDSTTPKQIRVNSHSEGFNINSIGTYKTIAHEGFPGHMYQNEYFYENIDTPWRKVCTSELSGYLEGYSTYVQFYSLKYLDGISDEVKELDEAVEVYQNSLVALVDIGIHYDGWTIEETKEFFIENGFEAEVDLLYRQMQSNPTDFISYYVGYMEFKELREKAEKELGDKFIDKDFHEVILKTGPAPFEIIENKVDEYIKNTK